MLGEESELVSRVIESNENGLKQYIAENDAVLSILLQKGSIRRAMANIHVLATNALVLGQHSYVMQGSLARAIAWLSIPATVPPGCAASAQLMRQAEDDGTWDGQRLTVGTSLELIVCQLLLGQEDAVRSEFNVVLTDRTMFDGGEAASLRRAMARHLIHAAAHQPDGVTDADYRVCHDLGKAGFLKDYHLLMLALRNGSSSDFNSELEAGARRFRKRKSSRLRESAWGYGPASEWCFDALGTAICRVARLNGIDVQVPDARLYPLPFWRDASQQS